MLRATAPHEWLPRRRRSALVNWRDCEREPPPVEAALAIHVALGESVRGDCCVRRRSAGRRAALLEEHDAAEQPAIVGGDLCLYHRLRVRILIPRELDAEPHVRSGVAEQ